MKLHPGLFDPEDLPKRLLKVKPVPLRGRWYRMVPRVHAEAMEETGPSFSIGGRFNPPGEFGALYFGETPRACLEERLKFYGGRTELVPDQALGEFEIEVSACLDLTDPEVRKILDLMLEEITEPLNHGLTRLIGQAAWRAGIEAIRFPSAAASGRVNLAVFRDHLKSSSVVRKSRVSFKSEWTDS